MLPCVTKHLLIRVPRWTSTYFLDSINKSFY